MSAKRHCVTSRSQDPEPEDEYTPNYLATSQVPLRNEQESATGSWGQNVAHFTRDDAAPNVPAADTDYLGVRSSASHTPSSSRSSSYMDVTRYATPTPQYGPAPHHVSALLPFHDAITSIFKGKNVSLSDLGETVVRYDENAEYEDILTKKLKEAHLDLDDVKTLEHRAKVLSQSSDLVVRELTTIVQRLVDGYVGTNIALGVCLHWCRDLQSAMVKTNAQVARVSTSEQTLPKGHSLSARNLSRNWRVLNNPPFKEMDLNKLLRNWVPNSRIAKDNHYVLCLDFLRYYLSQACTPCESVKKFACRLNGKGGKGSLLDFPDHMASLVVDFLLDGFGLGVQELDSSVEQLIRNPTWYWTHLGRTDEDRAGAHEERVAAKAVWAVEIRRALQKALNEVRCYHRHPDVDVLVPSSKRGRADQASNQEQGDDRRCSNQEHGDEQRCSNQEHGDEQRCSNQPHGDEQRCNTKTNGK